MGKTKKRKPRKRSGHYCWACDAYRANERFSGKGHRRHLCKDCSKLGAKELEYRQELRNLQRCVTWEGIIPRKRRKTFQRFLQSPDVRVRILAEEMAIKDTFARRMQFDCCDELDPFDDANLELQELWQLRADSDANLSPEDSSDYGQRIS